MALKLTAEADNSRFKKKKDDPLDMSGHDINVQRLYMLKDAIDRYKYKIGRAHV